MERKETIRSAYRMTGGNNFYDGMIICSTQSGARSYVTKQSCKNQFYSELTTPLPDKMQMLRFLPLPVMRLALVGTEIEGAAGKAYDAAFEEMWNIYRSDMLERFPYIGGDDASGTKNLTEAYMLVAMGEYLKKHGMATEDIGHLMTTVYERRMMKMSGFVRKVMGRMFTNPKMLNKMFLKKDTKNAANAAKNPGSFETKTQLPPEAGYDFSYHNLVCPLASFAKRYGYEDYMPYLCNLDYVMFGIVGAPLFREHTCMENGGYCDFKLKVYAEPMPYWPPVFSQGKEYK